MGAKVCAARRDRELVQERMTGKVLTDVGDMILYLSVLFNVLKVFNSADGPLAERELPFFQQSQAVTNQRADVARPSHGRVNRAAHTIYPSVRYTWPNQSYIKRCYSCLRVVLVAALNYHRLFSPRFLVRPLS